jgi:hypothetical protein
VREQHLLTEVLKKVKAELPFALLGINTDNDTVFINETLKGQAERLRAGGMRHAVKRLQTRHDGFR